MVPLDMTCGCIHETKNSGMLEVIEYNSAIDVTVRFIDTGTILRGCESGNIRKGAVMDRMRASIFGVGFIGYGDYISLKKGKPTKAYQAWRDMIRRCYDKKTQEKQPTYKGCTVCKEWHNFQNFAKWYEENMIESEFRVELDKDIKVKGNKVYSPETCTLVSSKENRIESAERNSKKEYYFIDPEGHKIKIINLSKYCRENGLDKGGMWAVHNGKGRLKSYNGYTKA